MDESVCRVVRISVYLLWIPAFLAMDKRLLLHLHLFFSNGGYLLFTRDVTLVAKSKSSPHKCLSLYLYVNAQHREAPPFKERLQQGSSFGLIGIHLFKESPLWSSCVQVCVVYDCKQGKELHFFKYCSGKNGLSYLVQSYNLFLL